MDIVNKYIMGKQFAYHQNVELVQFPTDIDISFDIYYIPTMCQGAMSSQSLNGHYKRKMSEVEYWFPEADISKPHTLGGLSVQSSVLVTNIPI